MNHNKMIELLDNLVPEEGVIFDIIEKVDIFRITKATPREPKTYEPSIIFLAQGNKRLFIGDEVITYDPLNYLVLSVPLPLECETNTTKEKPLLGLTVKVDAGTIGEIMLKIDDNPQNSEFIPKGIYSANIDSQLINAITRLLESLSSSADRNFLGPMIVREIIYRVLCGEKGDALRALAYKNQHFFQIAKILDKIHKSYNNKFDLNSLALEAGMSISAFHSGFKAVTNTSPLQYIKNIKLQKAKMLMVEEGVKAYNAAYHVGYESISQFNREYKRLFGITPAKDTAFNHAGI
ncbi:MAG: AraC family transcriptional regulator [Leptospiraceae bacterium]|nr:AraC family transcriptional regulator [Leptospiraceae bacterium]